jgi:hypothetical protein
MSAPPHQNALFGHDDGTTLPVAVAGSTRQLSTVQKEFNRLTRKLETRRQALEALAADAERLRLRWAEEAAPRLAAVDRAMQALIRRLDATLQRPPPGPSLKKRERRVLVDYLLDLVENRLEHADSAAHASLEAIFDRHSDTTLAELREEEQEIFRSSLAAFAEELGLDASEDSDEETLRERIGDAIDEREAAHAAEQAQRAERRRKGRPSREQHTALRREEARRDAGQSLRDVFRRLASALHPDRESNPEERARKTTLMQQANQAYESDDLMTLLRLQVEADQLDPERLAAVPEERLRGYNLLLKEQIATVDSQIDHTQATLREEFSHGFRAPRRFHIKELDHAIDQRLADMRRLESTYRHDLELLDHAAGLRALIRALEHEQKRAQREEEADLDALLDLVDIDTDIAPTAGGKQRKRGR